MRLQRSLLLPFLMALCLLSGSLVVGCGGQGAINSQPDSLAPAPISLRDPFPGQLEAYFNVTMGGYERATRETTTIGLSFTSHGRLVQFTGSEHLSCNGAAVPLHNQVASFQIVEAPTSTLVGKALSCTYSAAGASATLAFTVPQAPAISSPRDQAQVLRSTRTLITYKTQGRKLMGIVVLGTGAKAIARLETPGTMQATADTSAFPKGEGSISLTQTLSPRATQTGVSFKSLGVVGTAMTMVTVIWT
jgi:hypothetical protein